MTDAASPADDIRKVLSCVNYCLAYSRRVNRLTVDLSWFAAVGCGDACAGIAALLLALKRSRVTALTVIGPATAFTPLLITQLIHAVGNMRGLAALEVHVRDEDSGLSGECGSADSGGNPAKGRRASTGVALSHKTMFTFGEEQALRVIISELAGADWTHTCFVTLDTPWVMRCVRFKVKCRVECRRLSTFFQSCTFAKMTEPLCSTVPLACPSPPILCLPLKLLHSPLPPPLPITTHYRRQSPSPAASR